MNNTSTNPHRGTSHSTAISLISNAFKWSSVQDGNEEHGYKQGQNIRLGWSHKPYNILNEMCLL